MQSKGLEEIMHTVLTIGNAMNGGTWKGSAVGFRLSSLPKLNQTKSSDGKCTVLDYITQVQLTFDARMMFMVSLSVDLIFETSIRR